MSNLIRAGFVLVAVGSLGLAGCARKGPETAAPPAETAAPAETTPSGDASRVAWVAEALQRNPGLEVIATDAGRGVFTVRVLSSGELRTVSLDDLIAAPAASIEEIVQQKEAAALAASGTTAGSTADGPVPNYTITRDAGRVNITGPGIEIASSGAAPKGNAPATASATRAAAGPSSNTAGERRSEPMVCQGGRMLRVDNRVIDFDGDGFIVEEGCQLYLTNSHIRSGGTAIIASRGQVHIVNSTVSGRQGAIDASLGAEVFMTDAQIEGSQRRFDTAQIKDLGGNRYR